MFSAGRPSSGAGERVPRAVRRSTLRTCPVTIAPISEALEMGNDP